MTTYQISGQVTVSCWTEVEADSEEEAIEIAAGHSVAEIIIDGGYPTDEFWHIDSDGIPENIKVD